MRWYAEESQESQEEINNIWSGRGGLKIKIVNEKETAKIEANGRRIIKVAKLKVFGIVAFSLLDSGVIQNLIFL